MSRVFDHSAYRMIDCSHIQGTSLTVRHTQIIGTQKLGHDLISKQILVNPLPCVTVTDSRWNQTSGQYLYKCTIPTTWQAYTIDKCLSNTLGKEA